MVISMFVQLAELLNSSAATMDAVCPLSSDATALTNAGTAATRGRPVVIFFFCHLIAVMPLVSKLLLLLFLLVFSVDHSLLSRPTNSMIPTCFILNSH